MAATCLGIAEGIVRIDATQSFATLQESGVFMDVAALQVRVSQRLGRGEHVCMLASCLTVAFLTCVSRTTRARAWHARRPNGCLKRSTWPSFIVKASCFTDPDS